MRTLPYAVTTRRAAIVAATLLIVAALGSAAAALPVYRDNGDYSPWMLSNRYSGAVESAADNKDLGQAILISGDVVYVGGPFTAIKPEQDGPETTKRFLTAFNRITGEPINTFTPNLDAEVFDIVMTPDGSRLIVGGAFTSVDGNANHRGLASLDPATGRLQTDWRASIAFSDGMTEPPSVRDLEVFDDRLYVVGQFHRLTDSSNTTRARVRAARVNVWTGTPDGWRPTVQGGKINAIRLSPSGDRAYIGGKFDQVNGFSTWEFAGLDTITGDFTPNFRHGARPYSNSVDRRRTLHGIEDIYDNGQLLMYVGDMYITVKESASGDHVRSWVLDGDPQTVETVDDDLIVGGHFERCLRSISRNTVCSGSIMDPNLLLRFDRTSMQLDTSFTTELWGPNGIWDIAFEDDLTMWLTGDLRWAGTRRVDGLARYSSPRPVHQLTNPGDQSGLVGQSVSLQLVGNGRADLTLVYEASGLPDGLSINTATGLITGLPTTAEVSTVTVKLRDEAYVGKSTEVSFDWTVEPSPNQLVTTIVAAGSTWAYDDSGTDLGTAWRQPAFDDAAWSSGDGPFGFGDGDETTEWTAGAVTYYARHSFDFAGTRVHPARTD